MKKSKSGKSNWSLMVGVSGSVPAPLSPLKGDKPVANTEAVGKVTTVPLCPNQSGD